MPRWRAQPKAQGTPVGPEIKEVTHPELDAQVSGRHPPVEADAEIRGHSSAPGPVEVEINVSARSDQPGQVDLELPAQTRRRTARPAEVDMGVWTQSAKPGHVDPEIGANVFGNPKRSRSIDTDSRRRSAHGERAANAERSAPLTPRETRDTTTQIRQPRPVRPRPLAPSHHLPEIGQPQARSPPAHHHHRTWPRAPPPTSGSFGPGPPPPPKSGNLGPFGPEPPPTPGILGGFGGPWHGRKGGQGEAVAAPTPKPVADWPRGKPADTVRTAATAATAINGFVDIINLSRCYLWIITDPC